MGREQDRIRKKMEHNPIRECNRIQRRFCPELFSWFGNAEDPRHQSYTDYTIRTMLGTMYYKCIGGMESMQEMNRKFNDEKVCRNLYHFMGEKAKEYLPHGVTENEFLSRLDPKELESVQQGIAYNMIRRKTFEDARVFRKWQIIIDGVELDEGTQKKNEQYLSRCYHRGEENEFERYHRSVLEAKIYFGNNIVCSIATEPIENAETADGKSAEKAKQDCESKAFKRLAEKIKKRFPRLPAIITADALYVSGPVLGICEENRWDYIIRYKEGAAPSIAKEYRGMPEKETIGEGIEYQNEVIFQDRAVNLIYCREQKKRNGEEKETEFAWITNIRITEGNAKKIISAGRNRWKIENQGFNRQKHWQGNIGHAFSWNERAQKNHYLMEQIADFMKQLYEYFYLKKNEIKKPQKNISSELAASFGWQLAETEDMPREPHKAAPA